MYCLIYSVSTMCVHDQESVLLFKTVFYCVSPLPSWDHPVWGGV